MADFHFHDISGTDKETMPDLSRHRSLGSSHKPIPNGSALGVQDQPFNHVTPACTSTFEHEARSPDARALFGVEGMVAVVTGGGTGIGYTIARSLLHHGASIVYILARRLNVLEDAAQNFHNSFKGQGQMIPVQCDITSKESLLAAAEEIARRTGHINLLCCNAGVLGPDPIVADPTTTLEEWRERMLAVDMDGFTRTMHVNVTGGWFTLLAFLGLLDRGNKLAVEEKAGFGGPDPSPPGRSRSSVPSIQSQVIFTSSISALSRGRVARVSYSASKAAILHLVQKASSMLATYGIRVNAIAPGLFPSSMVESSISERDPESERCDHHSFIPSRSFGNDEHLSGTLLYLAGRSGSYCNGTILVIDGGRLSVMNAVVNW